MSSGVHSKSIFTDSGKFTSVALLVAAIFLSSCTVGPDYARPPVTTPSAYKEPLGAKTLAIDDVFGVKWWEVFRDSDLNALEEQVDISNQNIVQAEARFRQARALVQSARAAYYPTVSIGIGVTGMQQSPTSQTRNANTKSAFPEYTLPIDVSWELDVWGRIRRSVESNEASAQASAADLEGARLSARAEIAQDYFLIQSLDAQIRILNSTVIAFQKSLELTNNRYNAGVASHGDVLQAETQLKTTQAQAIDLGVQRAKTEHALAVLLGEAPADFSLSVRPAVAALPTIPGGVPDELLARRPDVASGERTMAAANAQIGVAQSAYYPTVAINTSGGFESESIGNWFSVLGRFWSAGISATQTLFDGGLRQSQVESARAVYEQNIAAYRQTVLTGYQEVEDNLAAQRILANEAQVQDDAVKAAEQSLAVIMNQYQAGIVSYLNVIVAQTTALNNETTAVNIQGRRLNACVLLIKALGGGWKVA
jgi:NodT family efflux transporter outer membrane factor (OMF) lipoprotein